MGSMARGVRLAVRPAADDEPAGRVPGVHSQVPRRADPRARGAPAVTPARRLNPSAQATAGTAPTGWLRLAHVIWPRGRSPRLACSATGSPALLHPRLVPQPVPHQ